MAATKITSTYSAGTVMDSTKFNEIKTATNGGIDDAAAALQAANDAADDAAIAQSAASSAQSTANAAVPKTTTVNGKALSGSITLTAQDVGGLVGQQITQAAYDALATKDPNILYLTTA